MVEKGFWFPQGIPTESLKKALGLLDQAWINYLPPITASVVEPMDMRNLPALIETLAYRELIDQTMVERLYGSLSSVRQIVIRDTNGEMKGSSLLTREDYLTLAVDIPFKLSPQHLFVDLDNPEQFEQAKALLTAHNVGFVQPVTSVLKKWENGGDEPKRPRRFMRKQPIHLVYAG